MLLTLVGCRVDLVALAPLARMRNQSRAMGLIFGSSASVTRDRPTGGRAAKRGSFDGQRNDAQSQPLEKNVITCRPAKWDTILIRAFLSIEPDTRDSSSNNSGKRRQG